MSCVAAALSAFSHLQRQRRVELEEVTRQGKRDACVATEHQSHSVEPLPETVSASLEMGWLHLRRRMCAVRDGVEAIAEGPQLGKAKFAVVRRHRAWFWRRQAGFRSGEQRAVDVSPELLVGVLDPVHVGGTWNPLATLPTPSGKPRIDTIRHAALAG